MKVLTSRSRALVTNLLRKPNPSLTEIGAVAKVIASDLRFTGSTADRLIQFAEAAFAIDAVKVQSRGQNSSTAVSNRLIQGVSQVLALQLVDMGLTTDKVLKLVNEHRAKPETMGWMYPKMYNVAAMLEHIHLAREFASHLDIREGYDKIEKLEAAIPDIDEQIEHMMLEINALRKYGVKPCYFQDGVLHSASQAWVFVDVGTDIRASSQDGNWANPAGDILAGVILAKKRDVVSLEPQVELDEVGIGKFGLLGYGLKSMDFFTVISRTGELDLSDGLGIITMEHIFADVDRKDLYRLLKVSQLMRLYDLVMPLEVVASMPAQPGGRRRLQKTFGVSPRRHPLDPTLILPRLRAFTERGNFNSLLDQEAEEADAETRHRAAHEVAEHSVVYHVRRLPEGHKPSAAARKLARETMGIMLADNETFVRPHTRGSAAPNPRPHKAKKKRK